MKSFWIMAGAALGLAPAAALAEPGMANEVYGPSVYKGQTEIELRTGVLSGGANSGDWVAKGEWNYGVTTWWRPAAVIEFGREGGGDTQINTVAIENVFDFTATRTWPVHFGAYLEYEHPIEEDGPDELELKLLTERDRGALRLRADFVGATEIGGGASDEWEYGYAVEGFYAVVGDFRVGVQGFGDLGTNDRFGHLGEHAHYWGPATAFDLVETSHGELEMQLGYLFGMGDPEADGQFRFKIEWER